MRLHEVKNTAVAECGALVIGSGCAGLNAADCLDALGVPGALIVTEGMNMGTSRNTGSDKQTYYKLSVCGDDADSVEDMAETLFSGGGVEGDIALCEAAGSLRAFYKLISLGVPFPTNEYGEYAGYKTDHDPRRRATSAGPLTSRFMTEALEKSVRARNIPIVDGVQIVRLLTGKNGIAGALGLEAATGKRRLFRCPFVIAATGGPAIVYRQSVYPESQTGATGLLLEAGAPLRNISEWQYGLASVGFRWNVSGTYQQALPRYVAVGPDGAACELLPDYFGDPFSALDLVFLKGYQWPFDAGKAGRSSMIDIIVHEEIYGRGRRVFMDFTRNPSCIDEKGFDGLGSEAREYLSRSGALFGTPIERLRRMNPGAIDLYAAHGVDLTREMLEIGVCAQHSNGGAAVDGNWETPVRGLFVAGEAAGTFGAYRPGGSALNSTQVGSMRAAECISRRKPEEADDAEYAALAGQALDWLDGIGERARAREGRMPVGAALDAVQREMSACAAHIRDEAAMRAALGKIEKTDAFIEREEELPAYMKLRDALLTQRAMLGAMLAACARFGSHGSAMVIGPGGEPVSPRLARYQMLPQKTPADNTALYTALRRGAFENEWRPVSPIPKRDMWFENVWRAYRQRMGEKECAAHNGQEK